MIGSSIGGSGHDTTGGSNTIGDTTGIGGNGSGTAGVGSGAGSGTWSTGGSLTLTISAGASGSAGAVESNGAEFKFSPLLDIDLEPCNLSIITLPFLVETTSVCEDCNNPCA